MLDTRGIHVSMMGSLAKERIAEAQLLLRNNHPSGAAYIVGYAVEILLKALIARQHLAGFWPIEHVASGLKIHDLELLAREAGLNAKIKERARENDNFERNWITFRTWRPSWRYRRISRRAAADMVNSVAERRDGVVPWLFQRME